MHRSMLWKHHMRRQGNRYRLYSSILGFESSGHTSTEWFISLARYSTIRSGWTGGVVLTVTSDRVSTALDCLLSRPPDRSAVGTVSKKRSQDNIARHVRFSRPSSDAAAGEPGQA